ncbi:uncharacterized protein [Elaeis guineensis]
MRPTDAEIRQFAAARKRPASGAGPSRPSKRPAPVQPTVEASATEGSEPIIALAAPTVRVEERPTEEVAEGVSAVSPPRVEPDVVREAEHRPEASAGATGGAGSNSSVPSLPAPSVGAADRGKAPMEPSEEERSMPPSAYYPEGASALADHNLARRLCQGILLPTDVQSLRSRQVTEMLSRFYPSMVELIFTMSELEAGYRRFGDVRAAFKERSAAAEAERGRLVDQLQESVDREAKLTDEVSRLMAELKSAKKEAKHKGRVVRRLRRERDGATSELQGEREQLRASLGKLAETEEDLSIAQIDAEIARAEAELAKEELAHTEDEARSARESADRAVEDFRASDRYKEEMLESGFASYRVGFEDGRDAVHALYPEVDVSRVVPLFAEEGAEEEGTEEMADQPSGGVIVVEEAVPEQVPTEVPLSTEAHLSAADQSLLMAETPIIPDPPSVEEIDQDG